MSEHLTPNKFEDYRSRRLPAGELLSASDHLASCEECRRQVESAFEVDSEFLTLRTDLLDEALSPGHLTLEQAADFADGRISGEQIQAIADHLTICEWCALSIDGLRGFKDEIGSSLDRRYQPAPVRPRKVWRHRLADFMPSQLVKSPALTFGSALMVLLLVVIGWIIMQRRQSAANQSEVVETMPVPASPLPSASSTAARETVPVIAKVNDAGGVIALDRQGNLSGADYLPPQYRRIVKEALAIQQLERPALLSGLTRRGSSLMSGDDKAQSFSVIEPVGKVLLTDVPIFRWSPLEGATGYIVEVYDETFKPVTASSQLAATSWVPVQRLERGRIYSWQVKAIKDGEEIKAPLPPAPQAKFRILDQARANELAHSRRVYSSSHLLLGMLYARAGLLDAAEQEFRSLKQANPDSEVARKLSSQVTALRR